MIKKHLVLSVATVISLSASVAVAGATRPIHAVGSSTVYPFVTVAAEEFGKKTGKKTPIIESTGTGGGFKIFCNGVGNDTPDLANASRAIKASERKLCAKNNVKDIVEAKIGFDGIVFANAVDSEELNVTTYQLFLALAKKIPTDDGKLIDNPYQKWSDIDAALPATKINVYGPPPTSGTRDAFVELVLEKACKNLPEFKAAYPDKKTRKKACHEIREDGAFIESGENDNLIIQKLTKNPIAYGIFGYSFLDQNSEVVKGNKINGVLPEFENISDGSYAISRPLFVYVKGEHLAKKDDLKTFVSELVSSEAIGEDGYVTYKGLIPLPAEELSKLQNDIKQRM